MAIWVVMASGVGMLLSAWYVRYRDVQPIWDVLTQILFYASPIIFIVAYFKTLGLEKVAMLSLIAMLNTQMGHALIRAVPLTGVYMHKYGKYAFPSSATAAGGFSHLLVPMAIVVGLSCWATAYSPARPRWSPSTSSHAAHERLEVRRASLRRVGRSGLYRRRSEPLPEALIVEQPPDGRGDRLGSAAGIEAVDTVHTVVAVAMGVGAHDGRAGGHRFQRRERETLVGRALDEHRALVEQSSNTLNQ